MFAEVTGKKLVGGGGTFCTRSFTKCDDLYSEILVEFKSITIIFVWGEYNLHVRGFYMTKIVHSLPKTSNFQEIEILVVHNKSR